MDKVKNKTAQKYKEMIMNAFIDLLKIYSYDEITIKQIALQADVSRQTFYRHFQTKEDIVKEYSILLAKEISAELTTLEDHSLYNILLTYFTFWSIHRELLQIVNGSNCESFLMKHYNAVMFQSLDILRQSMSEFTDEEFAFVKAFMIGGFFQLKIAWAQEQYRSSPEKITKLLCTLLESEKRQGD